MNDKEKKLAGLAEELWDCYSRFQTMPSLSGRHPDLTIDDAYEIQLRTVRSAVTAGRRIAGKKIGLTALAMQEMFGIDTPDYGHIYDNMVWPEDQPLVLSRMNKPRVEPELAFILGQELLGPGLSFIDVLSATRGIVPCFEIIDSRIENWDITIVDSIADNASAAFITLGAVMKPADCLNLKNIGLVLEKNGLPLAYSSGAAVMGHPAQSVAWLANKLGSYGVPLRQGEIILSGSLTKAFDAAAGDVFTASFDGLGTVKAVFA